MQSQPDKHARGSRKRSEASKGPDNLASSVVLSMGTNTPFPNFSWEISNQGFLKPLAGSKQAIPGLEGHRAYAILVWKT
jgi:hypothetical protein